LIRWSWVLRLRRTFVNSQKYCGRDHRRSLGLSQGGEVNGI
jgi:hypothetical protein